MSTLEDSLNDGPGRPSHTSSPVSSTEDLSGAHESELGEDAGASSRLPGQGQEDEDEEDEEIIMEEFR